MRQSRRTEKHVDLLEKRDQIGAIGEDGLEILFARLVDPGEDSILILLDKEGWLLLTRTQGSLANRCGTNASSNLDRLFGDSRGIM